ncbi:hypothetical protein [Streptomyces mayteni]
MHAFDVLGDPVRRRILEREHAAVVDPEFWERYGPGASGVGWDGGLLGLAEHPWGADLDRRRGRPARRASGSTR